MGTEGRGDPESRRLQTDSQERGGPRTGKPGVCGEPASLDLRGRSCFGRAVGAWDLLLVLLFPTSGNREACRRNHSFLEV